MTSTAIEACTPEEEEAFCAIEARQRERTQAIVASSPLNDADEVAIQSFLVDFNTHPNPAEFEATGVNGYFQWWRAKRNAGGCS
tara:strand:- start:2924 stop:3175 length:252 start_codon:yes stop_codon:yes gene_type:complete